MTSIPHMRHGLVGLLMLVPFSAAPAQVPLQGPGIGQVTWNQDELYKPVYTFEAYRGWGNNYVTLHNGYVLFVRALDGKPGGGGLEFWNLGDPRNPKRVKLDTTAPMEFMEQHGYGFTSYGGKDYAVFTSVKGIFFWDLTDINNPRKIGDLDLSAEGITGQGYEHSTWSVFWQPPMAYVSATTHGLFVVDAGDPTRPKLVKKISNTDLGMPRVAFTFAVGNQLVLITTQSGPSKAVFLDISDPRNPKLQTSTVIGSAYASTFNGNKIFSTGDDKKARAYDVADPYNVKLLWETGPLSEEPGEYISVQDNYVMYCNGDRFFKLDHLQKGASMGNGSLPGAGQEGHPVALGNYAIIADDHVGGSAILPHEVQPDRRGPEITMVNPKPGAPRQALTSRIGVTLSDQIDLKSVSSSTFIVRKAGTQQALPGKHSGQQQVLNFSPDQALAYDTEYEVVFPKGGVKDYAGNGMEKEFISRFRTIAQGVTYTPIPRDSMTVKVPSEEPDFPGKLMVDGDFATFWHSLEDRSKFPLPAEVTFTFARPYIIRKLIYHPRPTGDKGRVTKFQLLASADGTTFSPINSGEWKNNDTAKICEFPEIQAKALTFKIISGVAEFASAAEIQIERVVDKGAPSAAFQPKRTRRLTHIKPGAQGDSRDVQGRLLPWKKRTPVWNFPSADGYGKTRMTE